ncbi:MULTISPECIES: potassium channel family protein [unclassified Cupriavidus]|uniref:potassium channel family protein n=1 Tax=unclassified Cupriavidus TaxID=2640874 RepID=UPI001AE14616|nr:MULTISPECIES: potassium channel family protein [unclassified Cupriavidus]MBP0628778.1 hypothetical protein [Cupriavidus sp. AcVe19-1a]MBP0634478.1 hypothetical protein [Cupriavidus sp. AcVe19-6a]
MLTKALTAFLLMALCVSIHAIGILAAFHWLKWRIPPGPRYFWRATRALISLAACTILLHLLQIVAWGLFYYWRAGLPDLHTALYFSAVTYTTTGYGDVVLPQPWRLVGGVEALTGILMCGLSTGLYFAFFSRVVTNALHHRESEGPAQGGAGA